MNAAAARIARELAECGDELANIASGCTPAGEGLRRRLVAVEQRVRAVAAGIGALAVRDELAELAAQAADEPELPGIPPAPTVTLHEGGYIELAGDTDAAIRAIQQFVEGGQAAQAAADAEIRTALNRRRGLLGNPRARRPRER